MTTLGDLIPKHDGPPPFRMVVNCSAKSHDPTPVAAFILDEGGEVGANGVDVGQRWSRLTGRDDTHRVSFLTGSDRRIPPETSLRAGREAGPLRRRETLHCDLCGDHLPARVEKLGACLDLVHGQGASCVDLVTLRTMLGLI